MRHPISRRTLLSLLALAPLPLACRAASRPAVAQTPSPPEPHPFWNLAPPVGDRVTATEEQWRALLGPDAYHVLREHGTERAFSGPHHASYAAGTYHCAGCGAPLFASSAKFDSGTGWPSFWAPLSADRVAELSDLRYGIRRVEVRCARCGGHLGHVFDDGPAPTGLRYCMNGHALHFLAEEP